MRRSTRQEGTAMSDDDTIASTMTAGQNLMTAREAVAEIESQIADTRAAHDRIHKTMEWYGTKQPEAPDYVIQTVIYSVEAYHAAIEGLLRILEIALVAAHLKLAEVEVEARSVGIEVE
jgi:hypothetical protein